MRKLFSLIAAVLFAGSMMADSFTITFKEGTGTTSDGSAKQTTIAGIISDGADYVSAVEATEVYNGRVGRGIKMGTGSKAGSLTLTLAESVNATSIVVTARKYNDTEKAFAIQGTDFTAGDGGDFAEYTYTYDAATEISSIALTSPKRIYFTSLTVNYEAGEVPPTPAGCDWDNIAYAGNGSGNADYTDRFKVCVPDGVGFVNIQNSFGTEAGFYVTFPSAAFGTISLEEDQYATQGAGMLLYVSAFLYDAEKEVTVVCQDVTYTLTVKNANPEVAPVVAMSLTQFLTEKPTTEVTLKDLTVIFATNKSTYVIDEDGVALVMYDANKTYYDGTLTAGKVLSGQKATYLVNKNQDEIIPTNAVEATDGVAPVPTKLTEKPTDAQINRYIAYDNVAATVNNNKYYIFSDVQLYGATSALKPAAEGNYDVEGIYIVYNSTVPELIVTALEEHTTTAIDNTVVSEKAVKMFENGQLIIIKNGVRYNAQGAVVR